MVLRLIQLTDSHLLDKQGGELKGVDTFASLEAVVKCCQAGKNPPDLIVATGDLSHDGSAASYRRFNAALEALHTPVMFIPGNHDNAAVMQSTLPGGYVRADRNAQIKGWNIIMIDSVLPGEEHGFLDTDELAFLDESLQNWPDLHALVCIHHQPVPVGSRWIDSLGLENPDELFDVIDRFDQVRGILFGHVHQVFETVRKGIRVLGAPATCMQFKPNANEFTLDDQPPGCRWLELRPDGSMVTEVVRIASTGEVH
jgi:Icc protein